MTEKKFKNVVVASTVGAVLLLFILVMMLVFQLTSISVANAKKAELENQIALYQQQIAEGKENKDTISLRWWIEQRARELGYVYEDDVLHE